MSEISDKIKELASSALEGDKGYKRSGSQTSEGKIVGKVQWASIVIMVMGLVETFLQNSESPWAGVAITACGLIAAVLTALGYAGTRAKTKEAEAKVDAAKLKVIGDKLKGE